MPNYDQAFASLFNVNMGIRPHERIVVFGDRIRSDEEASAAETERRMRLLTVAEALEKFAAREFGNSQFISFPATTASGAEPPLTLWQATFGTTVMEELGHCGISHRLLDKKASKDDLCKAFTSVAHSSSEVADIIIALSNNSTSHTNYRKLACSAGARFASLPHFDPDMFSTSMMVDWNALVDRTNRLAAAVNQAVAMKATTPFGTRLFFGKAGRIADSDTGILTAPGSFGNLPAGEVYCAPLEGTTEGEMIITHAPTHQLRSPLKLLIKNGIVTAIEGEDPYRKRLEDKFAENGNNRNIAELGIGTNDRATRPDNVLEAEKILGTIHVALGDNSGFGGVVSTPFHEDYVLFQPTLTAVAADGQEMLLLQDGKLLL